MCRIAVFEGVTDHEWLAESLSQFECSMGGDGNGYASLTRKEVIKGIGVGTDLIAMLAANEPGVQVFHTRFATYGGSRNHINHPFDCGKHGYLVHNGSWSDWLDHTESDYADSDTHCAALLVSMYGPGILRSHAFAGSGVWVLAGYDGTDKVLISHRGQHGISLFKLKDAVGGGWMIASEAPAKRAESVEETYAMEAHHAYVFDPRVDDGEGAFVKVDVKPVEIAPDPTKKRENELLLSRKYGSYYMGGWDDDAYDYGVSSKPTPLTGSTTGRSMSGYKGAKKGCTDAYEESGKGFVDNDGLWNDGEGGKYVPCVECNTYDYVSEHVKASSWICEQCVEYEELYEKRYEEGTDGAPFGHEDEIDEAALVDRTGLSIEELMQ